MDELYFEPQSLLQCGVHAVNNLLGEAVFARGDFERFADELTPGWWNPHKALFGVGNYDVNVLEYALLQRGVEVVWHDNRRRFDVADVPEQCCGLIVNVKSNAWLAAIIGGRHWISLRRIGRAWFNCDSAEKRPYPFPDDQDVNTYVRTAIRELDGYCLVTVRVDNENGAKL